MALLPRRAGRSVQTNTEYPFDIAVVCPAIKPHFWIELIEDLRKKNKANFLVIFVGHVRPDFQMPDHSVFIYTETGTELGPGRGCVPCVDIGYNYVFDNNLAPYITFIGDDLLFQSPFFDELLATYKKYKLDYPDRPMAVSNLSQAPGGGYDLMGWCPNNNFSRTRLSGITLGGTWLLSLEDARALGGGCKKITGCYQHVDKQLRFYSYMNGIIVVLPEDEIRSTMERNSSHGNVNTLSEQTGVVDQNTIIDIYSYTKLDPDTLGEEKYEIFFTTRTPGRLEGINSFKKQRWKIDRKPLDLWKREELVYEDPDKSHLSVKF